MPHGARVFAPRGRTTLRRQARRIRGSDHAQSNQSPGRDGDNSRRRDRACCRFKVIANPSVSASTVSSEELKGIFLITRTSLGDGSHVEPVLEKSGAVHETCLKQYLGKPIPPYRLITATCYSPEKGRCPKSCLPTLKWSPTWQEPRGDRICQFRDEHGRCQDSGS